MKKSVKIISTLLMVAIIVTTLTTASFASGVTTGGKTETEIINAIGNAGTAAEMGGVATKAANIVKTLRNIAAIAAVVIIAILGVKYMLGSVEEKAEYKKSFMPLIVGIVVVLASTQIATMIFGMAK